MIWSRAGMSGIRQLLGGRTPLRFPQADATFSQSASTPATIAVTENRHACGHAICVVVESVQDPNTKTAKPPMQSHTVAAPTTTQNAVRLLLSNGRERRLRRYLCRTSRVSAPDGDAIKGRSGV